MNVAIPAKTALRRGSWSTNEEEWAYLRLGLYFHPGVGTIGSGRAVPPPLGGLMTHKMRRKLLPHKFAPRAPKFYMVKIVIRGSNDRKI